ncbi:efflux RND transporter periplasmic adaptor subunit [Sediminitomix flava]|uniref:HlyD family secretion protein n=1 Tax=Sediminitomix flava TaxID=379075 RepID=A0A315Z6R4_SEDFL|nr:HlyD family efflux transporter periplasmic adaptor subunit [Sediminitomix flava]PWJ38445.1 HlyD family secretion protein [Sediminitomix flava]
MDKVISQEIQHKEKRKRYIKLGIGVVAIIGIGITTLDFLTKSVSRKDILIGVVERGEVSLEISARGRVEPVYQKALTAPFSTVLESVVKTIGDKVDKESQILILDREAELSKLKQMEDEAEVKRSQLKKEELRLNKELFDLETDASVTALEINNLKANLSSEKKLLEVGGTTEESVQKAETALQVAELNNKKLQNDLAYKKLSIQEELKLLKINLQIELENIEEQKRKLVKAEVKAGIDGAITFVNDNVGSSVQTGEVLARVANLDAFRIKGMVAESYSHQVAVGMEARIETSSEAFTGQVTSMAPSSDKGMVTFYLSIDADSTTLSKLRPDMIADVSLKLESNKGTLRVRNRGAFLGKSTEEIFVIRGGSAEKIDVKTGFRNTDWIEIQSGLYEGDSIIISNTAKFINSPVVNLKSE